MKNILHLQLSGNPGGIVTLCRSIALNSNNRNFMYFLFSGGIITDEMKNDGTDVYVANAKRYLWKDSIIELIEYCKKNEIDVLICHSDSPIAITHALFVKKVLPNIRLIMYLHSASEIFIKQKNKFFVFKMAKRADKIVAISEFVKKSFVEKYNFDSNKMFVVYNGVDCNRFDKALEKTNSNEMKLIYVGRLIEEKGIDILIDAISMMKFKEKTKMYIVGDGILREILETQTKSLGLESNVLFLGARTDIADLLKKTDFFVHPARCNEGFGITLIEAMASGVPCIAFERGAIPEIITNEKNGFIIEKISSKLLSDKLDEAYSVCNTSKYVEMSNNARLNALDFDINKFVENLECLYE